MSICGLNLFSNLRHPRPRRMVESTHLMLSGISQQVFLNQWGEPETQIGLNRLGSFSGSGSLFLTVDPDEEVQHSVWIYKKKDRILFFTRKRLTSHFRWSEFKERWEKQKERIDPRLDRKASLFRPTFVFMALAT